MTTASLDRPVDGAAAARRVAADRLAPLLAFEAALEGSWTPRLDPARVRARLALSRPALDPIDVVGTPGELALPFLRATKVMERAGLASNEACAAARAQGGDVLPIIAGWLAGDVAPRDAGRAVARRAAILVARGRLRAAVVRLRADGALDGWAGRRCPCCGGHPEFAASGLAGRTLRCARCDAAWVSLRPGCSGCGADAAPTVVCVTLPDEAGYRLVVCNACGLYVKHGEEGIAGPPLVERALTAHLDAAAEARGLRL